MIITREQWRKHFALYGEKGTSAQRILEDWQAADLMRDKREAASLQRLTSTLYHLQLAENKIRNLESKT